MTISNTTAVHPSDVTKSQPTNLHKIRITNNQVNDIISMCVGSDSPHPVTLDVRPIQNRLYTN